MPLQSPFIRSPQTPKISSNGAQELTIIDMRGLDLVSPYDSIQKNRTPNARNFRLYAEEGDDRRVAVSSRKGSGRYIDVMDTNIGNSYINTAIEGVGTLGYLTDWRSQKYTSTFTGSLYKASVRIRKSAGSVGPVVVRIHQDVGGFPGKPLAESTIPNKDIDVNYSYCDAFFVSGLPQVTGTVYHLVVSLQDDTKGTFSWSYDNGAISSMRSANQGTTWTTLPNTALNYKIIYSTAANPIKSAVRYAPASGTNRTIFSMGNKVYATNDAAHTTTEIDTLSSNPSYLSFAQADGKVFWPDGSGLRAWNGSTLETINHSQLPALYLLTFHKNVAWGVTVNDPNKIVYSVGPVEQDATGNTWYRGWLSTNFGYFPAPKSNDPITSIRPFQDTMIVWTASNKGLIYGSNNADVQPRDATGKKGAVSHTATFTDENFAYFVSSDGIYRFNGAEDKLISEMIQPRFSQIADLKKITISKWKRQIRFYYPSAGSSVNDNCLIWDTVYEEWLEDTGRYVSMAVPYTDGDDSYELAEVSSTLPAMYYAEVQKDDYGQPIDFYYECKYDSLKNPAKRKRLNKLYPLLEGDGAEYNAKVGIDKDRNNTPSYTLYPLATSGAKIGAFTFGDGTKIGTTASFKPKRIRASGYAYYWQLSVARKAAGSTIRFIGYVISYRTRKL